MQFHKNLLTALHHPSFWLGVSGTCLSLAQNIDKPVSTILIGAGGVCSLVALVLKTPDHSHKGEDK